MLPFVYGACHALCLYLCSTCRNLPFDVDQAALKRRLTRYGMVRYCRIMMNKETGLTTGSAFVQFKTDAAARRCLEAAEEETESGVQFEGQRLKISLALSRSEIERVHRERSNRQEKEDKRNLYLAREGGESVLHNRKTMLW